MTRATQLARETESVRVPSASPASLPWSGSVRQLTNRYAHGEQLAAGDVVIELLADHDYLPPSAGRGDVTGVGAVRSVDEHLAHVAGLWDSPTKLTGRHVVLALALEPAVGGPMLTAGDVASLLARWRSRNATRWDRSWSGTC